MGVQGGRQPRGSKPETGKSAKPRREARKGLSYHEQREVERLHERIGAPEGRLAVLTEKPPPPELYGDAGAKAKELNDKLSRTRPS